LRVAGCMVEEREKEEGKREKERDKREEAKAGK
jgi:hypothetical protein